MKNLTILSWNILAPVWCAPEWFLHVDLAALATSTRMEMISSLINASNADIIILCEVQDTPDALGAMRIKSAEYYDFYYTPHNADLWVDCLVGDMTPQSNGNAILLQRGTPIATHSHVQLSSDGNRVAVVETCDGLRIFATHLETEFAATRAAQVEVLLRLYPPVEGRLDIWGGDFNASRDAPELVPIVPAGYVCLSYRKGASAFGAEPYGWIDTPIDHVFVRDCVGCAVAATPMLAHPFVTSAEGRAPKLVSDDYDAVARCMGRRVEWNLTQFGSDHMPVGCTLTW